MKKVRNFALLILLGFTLSGAGCMDVAMLILIPMDEISKKTHKNMSSREFRVFVTCDEKNHQAYQEVLKEMGFRIYNSSGSSTGWLIDADRNEDEDLEIRCDFRETSSYALPTGNVGAGKKERLLRIYSKIPYFPKERIHQKALERLKNSKAKTKDPVPTK